MTSQLRGERKEPAAEAETETTMDPQKLKPLALPTHTHTQIGRKVNSRLWSTKERFWAPKEFWEGKA